MKNDKYSYKDRKYGIVSYDPNWVHAFESLRKKIQLIFGDVSIEHIGSTAVPNMSGKPCIDVLVMIDNLDSIEHHIDEMREKGFEYVGELVVEDSRLFRVMEENISLANIHFFPKDHPHNSEMLAMRDYLRSHPEEVEAYSQLKENLYAKYSDEYALYRKEKDEYMNELMKRIRDVTI